MTYGFVRLTSGNGNGNGVQRFRRSRTCVGGDGFVHVGCRFSGRVTGGDKEICVHDEYVYETRGIFVIFGLRLVEHFSPADFLLRGKSVGLLYDLIISII